VVNDDLVTALRSKRHTSCFYRSISRLTTKSSKHDATKEAIAEFIKSTLSHGIIHPDTYDKEKVDKIREDILARGCPAPGSKSAVIKVYMPKYQTAMDEEGKPIMVPVKDQAGEAVLEEDGSPKMKPKMFEKEVKEMMVDDKHKVYYTDGSVMTLTGEPTAAPPAPVS
jgi:hypothetical protein